MHCIYRRRLADAGNHGAVGLHLTCLPICLPTCPYQQEHGAALCVHFIGAHPQRQGQGLGGAMLRHICSIADERQLHAYLEASTHRSKVGATCV